MLKRKKMLNDATLEKIKKTLFWENKNEKNEIKTYNLKIVCLCF